MENLKKITNNYLTIFKQFSKMKFAMPKYINTMNMSKKCQPICRFQYPKPSMKYTKVLLPLNEEYFISVFHEITTQFLKELLIWD